MIKGSCGKSGKGIGPLSLMVWLCTPLDFYFNHKICFLACKLVKYHLYTLRTCFIGHTETLSSLAFSYDGQLLASGSLDGAIKIWDVSSSSLKHTLEGPGGDIEVFFFKMLQGC